MTTRWRRCRRSRATRSKAQAVAANAEYQAWQASKEIPGKVQMWM